MNRLVNGAMYRASVYDVEERNQKFQPATPVFRTEIPSVESCRRLHPLGTERFLLVFRETRCMCSMEATGLGATNPAILYRFTQLQVIVCAHEGIYLMIYHPAHTSPTSII